MRVYRVEGLKFGEKGSGLRGLGVRRSSWFSVQNVGFKILGLRGLGA